MDDLVGRRKGHGGTSWDDGTYHGVRETKTFSSLYYPREQIFEDRREKVKKIIDVGLWGGNGGTSWDDGTYDGVRKIALVFGHCINSIRVVYDKIGMPVAAEKHGGVGGSQTTEIILRYPGECLVSISGYYSPMVRGGSPVIRSLTFKSNKRTFGPFGLEQGTPFASPVDGETITGFKGRSGQYLDAIGVHKGRSGEEPDDDDPEGPSDQHLAAIGMHAVLAKSPERERGHTISLPSRRWLDNHIQGTELAEPAYYGHPRVLTVESTPSPALPIWHLGFL